MQLPRAKSLSHRAPSNHSGKGSRLCAFGALCGAILLLLAGCGGSPGAAGVPAPIFRARAEGDGNAVSISASGDTAIVEVQSSGGIGAATIELVAGTPPTNLVVRLHLRGLEAFRLAYEQTVVVAEVPSGDSRSASQHVELPDGGTRPIAPDSPLWLDIRVVSAQAAPAPQQGYFEIRLPRGLLHDQQRAFALRWIDFYRG